MDKRLQLMKAGAEDLEQWMLDVIRQGLAAIDKNDAEWAHIISRMVDAKLKGVSQQLKSLSIYREEDWPDQMVETFGRLYLLTQGIQKIEQLPDHLEEQILAEAGVTTKKKDLLAEDGITDKWLTLSCWQGVNLDQAAIQKTWLWGIDTKRIILLIEYDYMGDGFESQFQIGNIISAEAVFYPESYPVRAVLKKWTATQLPELVLTGFDTVNMMLEAYTKALALNPWLMRFPCLLENMTPAHHDDQFKLIDIEKKVIPVTVKSIAGWTLLSTSSGNPITVFGEWDGQGFRPLALFVGKRMVDLGAMVSDTSGAKRFGGWSR